MSPPLFAASKAANKCRLALRSNLRTVPYRRALGRRVSVRADLAGDCAELRLDHRDERQPHSDLEQPAGHRREQPAAQHVSDARSGENHSDRVPLHAAPQIDRLAEGLRLVAQGASEGACLFDHAARMLEGLAVALRLGGHGLLPQREAILPTRYPRASAPARHAIGFSRMKSDTCSTA